MTERRTPFTVTERWDINAVTIERSVSINVLHVGHVRLMPPGTIVQLAYCRGVDHAMTLFSKLNPTGDELNDCADVTFDHDVGIVMGHEWPLNAYNRYQEVRTLSATLYYHVDWRGRLLWARYDWIVPITDGG